MASVVVCNLEDAKSSLNLPCPTHVSFRYNLGLPAGGRMNQINMDITLETFLYFCCK